MRFAAFASILPVLAGAALFDSIESLPRGWTFHRDASPGELVHLRVSLKEQNLDVLEKLFWDISSPDHEQYGQHLSQREVQEILAPAQDTTSSVVEWLRANSVEQLSVDGSWVKFTATVAQANNLLETSFAWFKNEDTDKEHLRTTYYSVPADIAGQINFISPTLKFPGLRRFRSTLNKLGSDAAVAKWAEWVASLGDSRSPLTTVPSNATCSQVITPQCLFGLYNIHYGATKNTKASYGSFLDEYARYADLTQFETAVAPYAAGANFSVTQFNGGGNSQTSSADSTEANLDNQYLISLSYPIPVTEFSTGGCGPIVPDQSEAAGSCGNEPYVEFLAGISALSNANLPQTLSISYGEDEQTWPKAEAVHVCNEFMKLGARGVTVVVASGDGGPGGICENNNGTKRQFTPAFPAGCPYVTTVGATVGVNPEAAVSFSGGGFSNYFAQPSYQKSAVAGYISALHGNFSKYYNASGRAYPDVSAQGVNFLVVDRGETEPVDGTSASTPTFAGVVALLNSARKHSGLAPLGFLNPLLYKNPTALTDIISGGSTGCSSGNTIPGAGFKAVKGWDASSGLGTPNFGKLLAVVAPKESNCGGVISNPNGKCPS